MNEYPKMLYKGGKFSQKADDQAIAYDADHEAELSAKKFTRWNPEDDAKAKEAFITKAVKDRRDRKKAERDAAKKAERARLEAAGLDADDAE